MRIALLALASGFALALAAPAFAEEIIPESQHIATPQPVNATQEDTGKYCHHLTHEGLLTTDHCRSAKSWEQTRLQNQEWLTKYQHHSYVLPVR
jgi:hypothetical protein